MGRSSEASSARQPSPSRSELNDDFNLNINDCVPLQLHGIHSDQLRVDSLGEEDLDGELPGPDSGDCSTFTTRVSGHLEKLAQ